MNSLIPETQLKNPAILVFQQDEMGYLVRSSDEKASVLTMVAKQGIQESSAVKEVSERSIKLSEKERQYNDLVKDLTGRIKKYPAEQIPSDIQGILDVARNGTLRQPQVRKLQEFIEARDILVVWREIAHAHLSWVDARLRQIETNFTGAFVSGDKVIKEAEGLSAWIEENHHSLYFVESLRLSELALTQIPKELSDLGNLKCLNLSCNQLISVPKELGKLQRLKSLSLNYNELKTIPDELGNLEDLNDLFLHYNQLTEIPKTLGNLHKLQLLYLSVNKLKRIPEELRNLRNLEKLELTLNQLKEIPEGILKLRAKINCEGNPLSKAYEHTREEYKELDGRPLDRGNDYGTQGLWLTSRIY